MSKRILRFFYAVCLLSFLPPVGLTQQQVGIPIKKQEGFVIDFKAPYSQLAVDIGENNFIETETVYFSITPQTQFLNKKDKALDPSVIRPGMRLEITGERVGSELNATKVKLKIDVEKWEVDLKGYFESLEGDKAWIDGQAVRINPGAVIRGDDAWKDKTFHSFNEMQLGSQVSIKGVRRSDGIVYALGGETRPNEFSKGDRQLKMAVEKNMVLPQNLSGGKGIVLGKEVKFVDSLELQTYVTKVGYKVIPRYEKDLPNDYPGKMVFRFAVIEDESFNAFALPDGSVFVHTGLLKQIKNEAQLAAILGHEIAHVTHEHSRKNLEDPKRTWLPLAFAVGGAASGSGLIAAMAQVGAQAMLNKFGRDAEDQADRVGLYYMMQAGYDPREAPKIWREISKGTKQDAIGTFLYSDHSSARQRLKNLNREIAYNYYDTDFKQTIVGDREYMNVVGVYFGWIPKPAPKSVTPVKAKTSGKLPATKKTTPKKRTNKTVPATGPRKKITAGAAAKPAAELRIRTINFQNFTYPLSRVCSGDVKANFAKVVKGKLIISRDKDYGPQGFQVGKIIYGDLTGDGKEEAVVSTSCGSLNPTSINQSPFGNTYAYTIRNNKLELLSLFDETNLEAGYESYFGNDTFLFLGGAEKILNGKLYYGAWGAEGICCPKWNVEMVLRWNGSGFVLEDRPRRTVWKN
jgi:hypothetical protein